MENSLSPAVPEAVRLAAKDAQRLGKDVKRDIQDLVSHGKDAAGDVASEAEGAVEDLSGRGRNVAERARGYVEESRESVSRVAGRVSDYADRNTALVAVASFGVGLLVGFVASRRGH